MKPEQDHTNQPFELPSPELKQSDAIAGVEQPANTSSEETAAAAAIEQGISAPAAASDSGSLMPPALPSDSTGLVATGMPLPSIASTPQLADDGDLIEKEWVEKAKEIVERTKHDPYVQNQEMTRIKADYLKKRYNKEIKLDEV